VPGRPLRDEELALILHLLDGTPSTTLRESLAGARVTDMNDGGMGSIRFIRPEAHPIGELLAEAQYLDSDGVLVVIFLNDDKIGQLFELDLWKVDSSPLVCYPTPASLLPSKQ